MVSCIVCERALKRSDATTKCGKCKIAYHKGCAQDQPRLSTGGFAYCCGPFNKSLQIESQSQSSRSPAKVNEESLTSNCDSLLTGSEMTPQLFGELMKCSLDNFYQKIMGQLSTMIVDAAETMRLRIAEDIRNEMLLLKTDITLLDQRMNILESKVQNSTVNLTEMICQEIDNRNKCSKNIIVYNFKTHENKDVDLAEFNNVLHDIVTCQPAVHAVRFGKSINGRPRPMKLFFNSGRDVIDILKHKTDFARRDISIKSDLTREQRSHLKLLQLELKKRISDGETNLTIKYVNNVPKIVNKSENV